MGGEESQAGGVLGEGRMLCWIEHRPSEAQLSKLNQILRCQATQLRD